MSVRSEARRRCRRRGHSARRCGPGTRQRRSRTWAAPRRAPRRPRPDCRPISVVQRWAASSMLSAFDELWLDGCSIFPKTACSAPCFSRSSLTARHLRSSCVSRRGCRASRRSRPKRTAPVRPGACGSVQNPCRVLARRVRAQTLVAAIAFAVVEEVPFAVLLDFHSPAKFVAFDLASANHACALSALSMSSVATTSPFGLSTR